MAHRRCNVPQAYAQAPLNTLVDIEWLSQPRTADSRRILVNRHNARSAWWASVCLFMALCVTTAWAQAQTGSTSDQTSSTTTKKSKKSKKADASTADDSAASSADSTTTKK